VDFTDVVSVGFVMRLEGQYSYILQHQIGELDVSAEDLLDVALANLREMRTGVHFHLARPPGSTVLWITAEDNFSAVRLLLPQVQANIHKEIGPAFCFTIPNRDNMLVWSADAPDNITQKHLREAREDYDTDEYNLSPHGYIYSTQWPCRRLDSQPDLGGDA